MKEVDGKVLYSVSDIGKLLNKSNQTINKYYKFSEMTRKNEISKRRPGQVILPQCIRINNIKYWYKEDIDKIIEFSKNIKRGDMAEFNRRFSWGKERGKEISERIELRKCKVEEEIRALRELSLAERMNVEQKQRFKYLKREANRKLKSI